MTFVVQAFQIPTGSMEPTLLVGDFLLVNKLVYTNTDTADRRARPAPPSRSARQDIVVFKYPNELTKDFVKRVIGLPGETIEIKDKQVFINDKPLDEPYKVHNDSQIIAKNDYYQYDDIDPRQLRPGHRARPGTSSSWATTATTAPTRRYWGFLPLSYIKGRPWVIYFSYKAERDAYMKTGLRDRLKKIVSFLPKARWNRMFKIIH